MPLTRDQAVVLGRLDYSETSQVAVLFTRGHGKVRAIARGIKRSTKTRFATGMDLLDLGEVVISSRQEQTAGLVTITEWRQTPAFSGLRDKLFRIRGGEYAAEIATSLTEDWDPHPGLFDALVATLASLADASEPLARVVEFQMRLLESVGSQPRFDACVVCGRTADMIYFSAHEGGMVCRHCEPGRTEKRELSPVTLELCRAGRAEGAAPNALVGAFGTLNYHIAHLVGREMRLAASLVPARRRRMVD